MSKPITYRIEPKFLRAAHKKAREMAREIHERERALVAYLYEIDYERLYNSLDFKALRPYINQHLKFSLTQSQRLATAVRRFDPVAHYAELEHKAGTLSTDPGETEEEETPQFTSQNDE